MRHLSISGGAFQIIELWTSANIITDDYNFNPKVYSGTSSGAIVSILKAMETIDPSIRKKANKLMNEFSIDDVFKLKPVNKKGGFTFKAYRRLTNNLFFNADKRGIKSVGIQDVPTVLKRVITEEMHREYVNSPSTPVVYVCAVEIETGLPVLFNLKKQLSFSLFLDCIAASCAIPGFTQPIKIHGVDYYDGGLVYHCPAALLLKQTKNINYNVSIYSRPDDVVLNNSKWDQNIVKTVMASTKILSMSVSKGNQAEEDLHCLKNGIKQKRIFLKESLDHEYDDDILDRLRLKESAEEETEKYWHQKI